MAKELEQIMIDAFRKSVNALPDKYGNSISYDKQISPNLYRFDGITGEKLDVYLSTDHKWDKFFRKNNVWHRS